MSNRTKPGASVFAHLNHSAAEDPEDKDQTGAAADEEGGAPDQEGDKTGKKGKKRAADPENGDPEADDGDDDTDAEDERDDTAAKARARERGRCAAIFRSAGAGRNPAAAAELAFGTNMSRSAAVRVLSAMAATTAPAPQQARGHGALRQRMLENPGAKPMAPGGEQAMTPGQRMVARNAARRDRKSQ
ncbi:MAG: hypothetical protein ABF665_06610 [Gluconacetobacter sp.]